MDNTKTIHIAEIGEIVIYNGDTTYAIDEITLELMINLLVEGNEYKVGRILWYNGIALWDYRLFKYGYCMFPCDSFIRRDMQQFVSKKYGLR